MKLGMIARSDNTGLGNQTKDLAKMLNPDKILLIDSSYFNGNKQHPEWYQEYNCLTTKRGMASKEEIYEFLNDLDVVISCEIFYNQSFISIAKKRKVKTVLQYNYEFLDHLANPNLELPDVLISPSLWNFEDVVNKFGDKTSVVHLPPPTDINLFSNAKEININKTHKKLLHIAGKAAVKDRNGTNTVIEMLNYSVGDYELVVKTQSHLNINCDDPRLTIDTSNPDNRHSLYEGFDAMVLPRRYAGLCLPMNEALISGLPVFMTDISPNNKLLPKDWLVPSQKISTLMTRTLLDVYEADPKELAKMIDNYFSNDNTAEKEKALSIGFEKFDPSILKSQYLRILEE
jgi:glycosyltransferase involved in cell wall biosynthesis